MFQNRDKGRGLDREERRAPPRSRKPPFPLTCRGTPANLSTRAANRPKIAKRENQWLVTRRSSKRQLPTSPHAKPDPLSAEKK